MMFPTWSLIPIMVFTIACDWYIMIRVGMYLKKTLTETARKAVADGAEDVKVTIFSLMPAMMPLVVVAIKEELRKTLFKVDEIPSVNGDGAPAPIPERIE